jgi:glucans biosynthesis protein C
MSTVQAPPVRAGAVPRPAVRDPWADNLKTAVIAGVVVAHAATAYLVDVDWYYEERTASEAAQMVGMLPTALGALFLLGPLFLLGGVFAARSLARAGTARFVRSRLVRLGLPLVVFFAVIDPLADFVGHTAQGLRPNLATYLSPASPIRDVGPLWFVAALLGFSLAYAGWRAVRPASAAGWGGTTPLRDLSIVAAAISLVSFAIRLAVPLAGESFLDLRWPQWGQAAGLFLVGVALGERGGLAAVPPAWERPARRIATVGLGGVAVLLTAVTLVTGEPDPLLGGWTWPAALLAAVEGVVAIALSLWVVAAVQRRWNALQGRVLARAGRGAYAAYVLHPLVLVLASWAARPLPVVVEVKFLVVAGLGVVGAFTVGWLLTRVPGLRRVV